MSPLPPPAAAAAAVPCRSDLAPILPQSPPAAAVRPYIGFPPAPQQGAAVSAPTVTTRGFVLPEDLVGTDLEAACLPKPPVFKTKEEENRYKARANYEKKMAEKRQQQQQQQQTPASNKRKGVIAEVAKKSLQVRLPKNLTRVPDGVGHTVDEIPTSTTALPQWRSQANELLQTDLLRIPKFAAEKSISSKPSKRKKRDHLPVAVKEAVVQYLLQRKLSGIERLPNGTLQLAADHFETSRTTVCRIWHNARSNQQLSGHCVYRAIPESAIIKRGDTTAQEFYKRVLALPPHHKRTYMSIADALDLTYGHFYSRIKYACKKFRTEVALDAVAAAVVVPPTTTTSDSELEEKLEILARIREMFLQQSSSDAAAAPVVDDALQPTGIMVVDKTCSTRGRTLAANDQTRSTKKLRSMAGGVENDLGGTMGYDSTSTDNESGGDDGIVENISCGVADGVARQSTKSIVSQTESSSGDEHSTGDLEMLDEKPLSDSVPSKTIETCFVGNHEDNPGESLVGKRVAREFDEGIFWGALKSISLLISLKMPITTCGL